MASNSDIFQQVRSAVDIVDIIAEHVALKKAGREFKGLCPFHEDHRPSMAVVPHKQIFHCFVCGMGGDVFKFVKEYHKMGNGEALRFLAQKAGIQLPELPRSGYGGGAKQEGPSQREQIAQDNEWACKFFEQHLRTPAGQEGLNYLHSRGLTDETIAKFRLGWSMGWTDLINAGLRLGIPGDRLVNAGLAKSRQDGSPYTVFRDRVMFPIIDSTGRVLAFGGRILVEKRDEQGIVVEPKYLNTPETHLFNKSQSAYGLNHARQHIVRTRTAVIVEGYMDVIACHQSGVSNVIATLGTALTPDHARMLKNYAQTIVLMFDSDDAGYRAADRALETFIRSPLDIKLSSVPEGKDPCDYCMKNLGNGGAMFQKLIDNSTDALTYQWQRLQKQFSATDSLSARQEAIQQFMRYVAVAMDAGHDGQAREMDPIRRGLILSKISSLVGMPLEDVSQTLLRLARTEAVRAQPRTPSAPGSAGGISAETSPQPNASANPDGTLSPGTARPLNVRQLRESGAAEAWVLGVLLVEPKLYDEVRDQINAQLFAIDCLRPLALVLIEYLDNASELDQCSLADFISMINNGDLVRQAIEIESLMNDWLNGAGLSPAQEKLLKHLHAESNRSLRDPLLGALQELVRINEAQSQQNTPIDDPAALQAFLDQAKARNQQGGDFRRLAHPS